MSLCVVSLFVGHLIPPSMKSIHFLDSACLRGRIDIRVMQRLGEGGRLISLKRAHECVRRPDALMVRLCSGENSVKQYEWASSTGIKRVRTTASAFIDKLKVEFRGRNDLKYQSLAIVA